MNFQYTFPKEKESEDEIIASYKIIKFIRETNRYMLYSAIRQTDNKPVLIKSVSKSKIIDDATQLQFQREVDSLFYLQSPRIIEFLDFFSDKHHYYLVFEKLPTLQDYLIKHRKLKEVEASLIFTDILQAVKFCHSNGIAIRSLSLDNIYVTSKRKKECNIKCSTIKLSGFELCSYLSYQSPKIEEEEISCFTAPEQFSKTLPRIDNKSDIWALGVILYMIITGCQPWDSSNPVILKSNINKANFNVPYWVSEPCRDIIEGMIKVKPLLRLSIDDALQSTFCKCSCENPTLQRLQQKQLEESTIRANYMFVCSPLVDDNFSDYKSTNSALSAYSSSSSNYLQEITDRPLPQLEYDNDGLPMEIIRIIKSPFLEPIPLSAIQKKPILPSKSRRTQLSISAQSCLKGVHSSGDAFIKGQSSNVISPKKRTFSTTNESKTPAPSAKARAIITNGGNRKRIARSIDLLKPNPLF